MFVPGHACMHIIVRYSHMPVFACAHFYVAVSVLCMCIYIPIH